MKFEGEPTLLIGLRTLKGIVHIKEELTEDIDKELRN